MRLQWFKFKISILLSAFDFGGRIIMTMAWQRRRIQLFSFVAVFFLFFILSGISVAFAAGPIIVDHRCTDITALSEAAINQAKANLHIAYGHTSHGSQLTTGMTGLVGFANGGQGLSLPADIFAWNNGGTGGALDLHDYAMGGDVGYYPQWVNNTRTYLDNPANADVNVIIWSWCGQASSYTEQQMIDQYLAPMTQLETDYPNVTFVYMTGHADGTGETGNLHLRNQQIRNYCIANNKVLYDFDDIECYDPDGNYYGDKLVDDTATMTATATAPGMATGPPPGRTPHRGSTGIAAPPPTASRSTPTVKPMPPGGCGRGWQGGSSVRWTRIWTMMWMAWICRPL